MDLDPSTSAKFITSGGISGVNKNMMTKSNLSLNDEFMSPSSAVLPHYV
ncbi:MAG: hypothetical protein ACI901_001367 [Octadecabacter sp.]|jgi:hypothetical protein